MRKPWFKKKKFKGKKKKYAKREPRTLEEKVLRTLTRRVVKTLERKHFILRGGPLEFLGCSGAELLTHLMKPHGGTWPHGFNIDHILPISIGQTATEVKKLSHYSNLRLMDEAENTRKGSLIMTDEQVALGVKLLGRTVEKTYTVFIPHVIVPRRKPVEDVLFGWVIKLLSVL